MIGIKNNDINLALIQVSNKNRIKKIKTKKMVLRKNLVD